MSTISSKAKIANIAANALLLEKRIVDLDTDDSNVAVILRSNFEQALFMTLEDLDLDSTVEQADAELIEEEPNELWLFSYKYPANCAFLRRLQSSTTFDTRNTLIDKAIRINDGRKCIFTNEQDAILEFIPKDIPLETLNASTVMCVGINLARISSPLIVGKGAAKLKDELRKEYLLWKAEAQETDRLENRSVITDAEESEFVAARTS